MIRKIADTIWQLLKSLLIAIVVLLSLVYLMDLSTVGTPAITMSSCEVYRDLTGSSSTNCWINSLTVVEEISDENAQGLSKIRYDNNSIGYVRSDDLFKFDLDSSEDTSAVHLVKVDVDIDLLEDNSTSTTTETVCTILNEINTIAEQHTVAGIYVEVSPHKDWSYFTNILEQMRVPYGYFIRYKDFGSFTDMTNTLGTELNTMYEPLEYNILPLAFDFSEQYISNFTIDKIKNYYSDDVVFYISSNQSVQSNVNYWTTTTLKQYEYESSQFASSNQFAIEFTADTFSETVTYANLNIDSLLYQNLLVEYNSLIEKK